MPRFPFNPHGGNPYSGGLKPQPSRPEPPQDGQFRSLRASLLFCPTCRVATPARERLLLVLPTGNKYQYVCAQCGTSTGEKTDQDQPEIQLFIP